MAKIKKKSKSTYESPFKNYWEKNNYLIIGVGLFVLILGFVLMAQGPWDNPVSLSISPLVLLIAYLIIFPVAILYKKKKIKSDAENDIGEDKR
ncbi:MAG: hypothetical protein A2V66_01050 [Ignavibacteria bacterium RBG_13_36_8]|nr:MAG: hypothetical protein A2V66_01050 [Ignavibacteria bacterium RBG_13_36_8]